MIPDVIITDMSTQYAMAWAMGAPGGCTIAMDFDYRSASWDVMIYPGKGGSIPAPGTAYVVSDFIAVLRHCRSIRLALDYKAVCRARESWCDLIRVKDRLYRLLLSIQ